MSFNYPPINGNGLPTMLPLLTNLANGNSFLPTLSANQAVLAAQHQSVSTSIAENVLEFNRTHSKLCQAPGAGPMDLDERDSHPFLQVSTGNEMNLTSAPNLQHKLTTSLSSDDNNEKSFTTFNPCDVMYNMGIAPQNLMNLMPGVMNMIRDTSSMVQTLPQYQTILNHQLPLQSQTTTVTASLPETCTTPSTASTSSSVIAKETITCKSCILLPPNPNAPPPSTRDRPKGCRTVFVGGLPENISEDVIREVFEPCGEITTLRLSKKNFCHIRFVFEASVDSAIYLSGYRIRINNQSDSANCGRLHVDFAQARDDQYEFECKQRQYQREQRHRERIERDRLRPLSPPPVVHYSDHEAGSVAERIKQDETFSKAAQILITWLDRGDCNKKNSSTFYSMIQSTNSHVRRLLNEKTTYEDELNKAKEMFRKHMQSLSTQLSQIDKVFGAASHKKVWDHFSKAQRKNIDLWKRQSMEVNVPSDSLESHDSDEMEMSEDDETASNYRYGKRSRRDSVKDTSSKKSDTMTYSNIMKTDTKDQQMKVLQETIRNLQTQLLDNKTRERENLMKIHNLELKLKRANAKELMQKPKTTDDSVTSLSDQGSDSSDSDKDVVCVDDVKSKPDKLHELDLTEVENGNENITQDIDANEAHLIGLMSAFLVVYPFGANLEIISNYIQQAAIRLSDDAIETILRKHKNIFREIVTDKSSNLTNVEYKWKFTGFDSRANLVNDIVCDQD